MPDRPGARRGAAGRSARLPPFQHHLLMLQRSAGNAAVQRLVPGGEQDGAGQLAAAGVEVANDQDPRVMRALHVLQPRLQRLQIRTTYAAQSDESYSFRFMTPDWRAISWGTRHQGNPRWETGASYSLEEFERLAVAILEDNESRADEYDPEAVAALIREFGDWAGRSYILPSEDHLAAGGHPRPIHVDDDTEGAFWGDLVSRTALIKPAATVMGFLMTAMVVISTAGAMAAGAGGVDLFLAGMSVANRGAGHGMAFSGVFDVKVDRGSMGPLQWQAFRIYVLTSQRVFDRFCRSTGREIPLSVRDVALGAITERVANP